MNSTRVVPGVEFLSSGCGVLFGESLAPLTVVVSSSALSQVIGDLAVVFSSTRRFGVYSLWFPRSSGFLSLVLCLLQLTHFCFICFAVAQPHQQYALFRGWDLYTLFVIRVINSGIFSTAFSLITTLFTDKHEEEGANVSASADSANANSLNADSSNSSTGVQCNNAYAILAQAARDAGVVRDDNEEVVVCCTTTETEEGTGAGIGAETEKKTDAETEAETRTSVEGIELAQIRIQVHAQDRVHNQENQDEDEDKEDKDQDKAEQNKTQHAKPKQRHGDSRLVEWIHGERTAHLPTRREFVLFPIHMCGRASRWITVATWFTLLPAFVTHLIPGAVVFALFLPGGFLLCGTSAALVYLLVLRRADVAMARHAARVVRRVSAEVDACESGATLALPRYSMLTPVLFLYVCVRALVIGALGSIVQLLFAAAVHYAAILYTRPVPLPAVEYWAVPQTWWALLNTRCYTETLVEKTVTQVESTRRALAFISFFV